MISSLCGMSACPSGGVEEHYIGEHQLFSCFGKLLYLYPSISLAHATIFLYSFHWLILQILAPKSPFFHFLTLFQPNLYHVGLMRHCCHFHHLMVKLPLTSWLNPSSPNPHRDHPGMSESTRSQLRGNKKVHHLPPAILATCSNTGHCYHDDDDRHLHHYHHLDYDLYFSNQGLVSNNTKEVNLVVLVAV